jgi:hypothetical protein
MSVIEFPGAELLLVGIPRIRSTGVHAEAFRELESNLRDCVRIGKIAANLTCGAKIEDPTLSFAVFHLAEMLMRLEKEYDARWHGMSRQRAHSQARAR